jgi:hypothetical protein
MLKQLSTQKNFWELGSQVPILFPPLLLRDKILFPRVKNTRFWELTFNLHCLKYIFAS